MASTVMAHRAATSASASSISTRRTLRTRVNALKRPSDVELLNKGQRALLAVGLSGLLVRPALAEESDTVDSAVNTVVDVVKAAGGAVRGGLSAVTSGLQVLKEGYDAAAPVVKQGYEAVAPVVEKAVKITGDVAGPALKAAVPVVESGLKEAGSALKASGLDTKAVADTTSVVAKTASQTSETVAPYANQLLSFLATKDPVTLGEYALGAVAFFYLAPPLLGLLGGSLRGYAGEITAASALDSLVNESGVVLVDIRTSREKDTSGLPDVPSSGRDKVLEVEFASTEDKKLRNQLRDPNSIEVQVTALQIASLKKIGKGAKVVLLDRYGPVARSVAKELARKGFSKVFVVSGGFDGGNGWVQSKLQIKPTAASYSAPSAFSAATRIISRGDGARRALPSPK